MRSIMWTPIIISFWVTIIIAEKKCLSNDDCAINQFCITPAGVCENPIICSKYNRVEAAKPAREASQCGGCVKGFVEGSVVESTKKADSCVKKVNSTSAESNLHDSNTNLPYVTMISIPVLFFVVYLYPAHLFPRCKWNPASVDTTASERQTATLPMVQNGISAANVPAEIPCKTQNLIHGRCDVLQEEQNTFSIVQEYPNNFPVDEIRLLHARAFHPPYYVRINPKYDPDANQTTFYPDGIVNESTAPSSASPGDTVPEQALAPLTDEAQDNMTNSALQRPGSLSPSTNQEGHGNGENNDDASGNSGGARYNNTNENANDNTD